MISPEHFISLVRKYIEVVFQAKNIGTNRQKWFLNLHAYSHHYYYEYQYNE